MKMILLLGTLFFLLLSNTAFAANWYWIDSDDKTGCFFDMDTIRYELAQSGYPYRTSVDTSKITCWEKTVYTQIGARDFATALDDWRLSELAYNLTFETFSLRNKTITVYASYYYREDGSLIYMDEGVWGPYQVIPESRGEDVFLAVRDYARTHHAQLIRNAYSN